MNQFTKTKNWIITSLLLTTASFANDKCAKKSFEQNREMNYLQMVPAYNAPSRIDVRGSWDVYAEASFTFWQPIQDNMDLGFVMSDSSVPSTQNVINMDFNYVPGFKTGLGINFDHDNWDSYLEYTWFRSEHGNITHLDPTNTNVFINNNWGTPSSTHFFDAKEHLRLHMDLLDWELARSYYVGTKLSFRPFFAARAAWIRQKMNVVYGQDENFTSAAFSKNKSHSWGIGPRAGLYSHWILGSGVRLYGNTMADILFTQYRRLKTFNGQNDASGALASGTKTIQKDLNCLRTHLEAELGLGWGSYFDNNNWHIDLSAGYGFQVFFDQNMFRKFTDEDSQTSFNPNGNIYLHGLTATARFDF